MTKTKSIAQKMNKMMKMSHIIVVVAMEIVRVAASMREMQKSTSR